MPWRPQRPPVPRLAVGRERRHPCRGKRSNAGPVGVRRRLGHGTASHPQVCPIWRRADMELGLSASGTSASRLPGAGTLSVMDENGIVYGLVCPTRYGSRSLWEAKRMSSGPAHPGILVGVDGFAVIKGCCAVSRARGNGAQCSAHPRARRMHARGQLIGSVLANGPNT